MGPFGRSAMPDTALVLCSPSTIVLGFFLGGGGYGERGRWDGEEKIGCCSSYLLNKRPDRTIALRSFLLATVLVLKSR